MKCPSECVIFGTLIYDTFFVPLISNSGANTINVLTESEHSHPHLCDPLP